MDEQYYIQTVLAGDHEAYRWLVERYQTGLIIYCEQMLRSRADAEDIAQEAFVKAYENLSRYDAKKARFSTWLYKIAANLAIDFLRKNRRLIHADNMERYDQQTIDSSLNRDEIAALQQAIDHLEPPKLAEIIRAYYWEGKSYREIAATFDTTTNTVGTWMRRAKAQLAEELV